MERRKENIKILEKYCAESNCYNCALGDNETGECSIKKPFNDYTNEELDNSTKVIHANKLTKRR